MSEQPKRRGRPPKADGVKNRPNVTIRMTEHLKDRIQSDCEKSGRSLSEEITERLERSYSREDGDGGPLLSDIIGDIAIAFRSGLREGDQTQKGPPSGRSLDELAQDPWCYNVAMQKAWDALDRQKPVEFDNQLHNNIQETFARAQGRMASKRDADEEAGSGHEQG